MRSAISLRLRRRRTSTRVAPLPGSTELMDQTGLLSLRTLAALPFFLPLISLRSLS
jgi:hypothetical protein